MGINSPWQLLLIFVIILLLFGTKRLRSLGSDLGSAIKGFKKAVSEESKDEPEEPKPVEHQADAQKVDATQTEKTEQK